MNVRKTLFIFLLVLLPSSILAYPSIYPVGVTIHNEAEAYEGYTTFAIPGVIAKNTTVYLIDMKGNILHTWFIGNGGTLHNILLSNGHLLSNRLGGKCPVMGCVAAIEERDWDGNLLWSYENDSLHHLAEPMPDGSVIAIFWDILPKEFANQIVGGIEGTEAANGTIYTDVIRAINRSGDVVWEWWPHERLNISEYPLNNNALRDYWPNINRVQYLPSDNPFNNKESLLVSFRKTDSIAIIEMDSKQVVWKWGSGVISHQHDPQLLSNGNILLFDNGFHRPDPAGKYFSRIVEINPRINQIVWEYAGFGQNSFRGFSFYSHIGGFVQRLLNGNTLITETTTGRVFEVNPEKEIVWEFVSPFEKHVDSVRRFAPSELPVQLSPPNPFQINLPELFNWFLIVVNVVFTCGILYYFLKKRKSTR